MIIEINPFTPNRKLTLDKKIESIVTDQTDLVLRADKLTRVYGVALKDLPISDAGVFIPFISRVQKFASHDSMFKADAIENGFGGKAINIYKKNPMDFGFESPSNSDMASLDVRWMNVVRNGLKLKTGESIGEVSPYVRRRPSTNKPVLLTLTIADIKKYIAISLNESSQETRLSVTVTLLDFFDSDQLQSFSKFIEKVGTNGLNALFALILSPKLLVEYDILSAPGIIEAEAPDRNFIFCAVPTKDVRAFTVESKELFL